MMQTNEKGKADGGVEGMAKEIVMGLVEDATVPGAIWTLGKSPAAGKHCHKCSMKVRVWGAL